MALVSAFGKTKNDSEAKHGPILNVKKEPGSEPETVQPAAPDIRTEPATQPIKVEVLEEDETSPTREVAREADPVHSSTEGYLIIPTERPSYNVNRFTSEIRITPVLIMTRLRNSKQICELSRYVSIIDCYPSR